MDNQQKKSTSEQIIFAVKGGELKMRPKWHFVLRAVLWVTGIAVAVLAVLYLFSLLMFITHETGIWMVPIFGWRGIFIFLMSIPWLLVLSVLIFIVVLELLVRHYYFAYRLPLLYSALAVLLVVVGGGMLVAQTPLHGMLSHCSRGGQLPNDAPNGMALCGTGIYRDLGPRRFGNIHYGEIDSFDEKNFILANRQQEKLLIVITKRTRLPFGEDFFVGDKVVVVGDRHGDQVEAFGVSKVNE